MLTWELDPGCDLMKPWEYWGESTQYGERSARTNLAVFCFHLACLKYFKDVIFMDSVDLWCESQLIPDQLGLYGSVIAHIVCSWEGLLRLLYMLSSWKTQVSDSADILHEIMQHRLWSYNYQSQGNDSIKNHYYDGLAFSQHFICNNWAKISWRN